MSDFFTQLGMPFQDSNKDYATLDFVNFDNIGSKVNQSQFDNISIDIATTIDKYSLQIIQNPELVDSLGYPKEITNHMDSNLVAMRLGYVVDINGKPILIETNSQTPSFWWECETGTDKVLGNYNKMRNPSYYGNLQNCLKSEIKNLHKNNKDNKNLKPNIGLVTCDSEDDIFQMTFIKNCLSSLQISDHTEILTINRMDISTDNKVFSLNTDKEFDILLFWYPIEWLVNDIFVDGTKVFERLFELVKDNKIQIFNGMQSFLAQNKNLLAYITEIQDTIHPNIAPTFYTLKEFENSQNGNDWIGKPIFGREGKGIFGKQNGKDISGDCDDEYYNNQWYVYQPFIQTMPLIWNKKAYDFTLEKWVYKIDNVWQVGGQSLRISTNQIIDNKSKWLSIN